MKTGRSLNDLAAELTRQADTKKDYIAPQGAIEARVVEGEVVLDGINGTPFGITNYAHGQFGDYLDIPKKYYDRMRIQQPDLLATNLNTWFKADGNEKRMVRTLDGKVRGYMSPKYRPLDNFDLAGTVLPALIEKQAEIMSAELTETHLYIKAILPSLSDELPDGLAYGGHQRIGTDRGHLVAALVISNSEVGAGTLRVEPSVFTTFCTNLAVMAKAAMKKYHVGRAGSGDEGYEVFRDETRIADDKAFWLKVRDVTNAAFDEQAFRIAITEIREAGQTPITSVDLPKVVEVATKRLALPESLAPSILTHLARGGDLTKWGLSSAITRVANDADEYEAATELERAGGKVLALPAADWQSIATAA